MKGVDGQQRMRFSSKIVRNSVANYGGSFAILAVGFLLAPFLVHSLGDSRYGAWVLVGSIGSYFWLLDFGLGSSVTKFVSELRATGERERLNSVVSSSFAMLLVVGLVSLGASAVVAGVVDLVFRLPAEIVPEVRAMIYITGIALMVSFPFGVFGGVLRGCQRYDLVNAVGATSTLANAALSVAVIKMGYGLVGLACVGLVTNLIVGGGRFACTRWVDPELVLRPSMVKLATLRDITGFSVWVFVINVAVQVVYRTSPIIIASVLSVALVTPYAIASALVQYVRRLVEPILAVLLPAYAELSAIDDLPRVRGLFLEGSKIVGAVAVPMVMGLFLLGKPFILLWMGPAYEQSSYILYFLLPPLFLGFLVASGDKLLWARGKVRVNSYVAMVDTVTNLALSVLLAKMLGVVGVAVAASISVLATNGLWLLPYICREAGISPFHYLSVVGRPLLLPAVPSAALVSVLMRVIGVDSYLHVAILAGVCVGSYWGLFFAATPRKEKARWLSIVRTALAPSRARGLGGVA